MEMNMVQAINSALSIALERDENVILLGEDIGRSGGVFRVTAGLQDRFGGSRVLDTPLEEQGIVGASIGMAALGLRPVPEIQFDGFSYVTLDQLVNHAARLRLRTRGRLECPLVMRVPVGGGIRALEHHSDSPETYYAHTPGLKVVTPSGPRSAKGLLLACLSREQKDPIIFFEPKKIYRAFKEDVPDEAYEEELKARVVQEGDEVTVITYGSTLRTVLDAVAQLGEKSSLVEVIDLQTLSPIDDDTIIQSVKKTGKVIVVHEAPKTLGIAAEISALISENVIEYMKAPIVRVTGFDVPMPLARSEEYFLPSVSRVLEGLQNLLNYSA